MRPERTAVKTLQFGFLSVAATGVGLIAGGCGGGMQSKSAEPPQDAQPAFTDANSALAEMDRAEAQLAGIFGGIGAGSADSADRIPNGMVAPAASAAPTAAPTTPPQPQTEPTGTGATAAQPVPREPAKEATQLSGGAADPCFSACRALASMERAANHLCGLAGESDSMCTNARDRVKNASARVSASCSC
ncbi:MAG: hypothetical protein IPK82_33890 [Polyangiaceae bacterium]|nr:hypothetical protein [Polyangiaceae bacterium]